MNEINKIRTIHDVKTNFPEVDKSFISLLEESIIDNKEILERYYRGFSKEDLFFSLWSSLPWVSLIHKLDETQLPEQSKEKYQVPDFTVLFETYKKTDVPVFIETKSVPGKKIKLTNIQDKQVNGIKKYGKVFSIPYYYAIFWSDFYLWTINSIDIFKKKKRKYEFSLQEAIKTDLSVVFSDFSFYLSGIYRKIVCDSSLTRDASCCQTEFGVITNEYYSFDKMNWNVLEAVESAVLDAVIPLNSYDLRKNDSITEIYEESQDNNLVKLSTMIMRHIAIFKLPLTYEYFQISIKVVYSLINKLNIKPIYMLPLDFSLNTDYLIQTAFGNNSIYKQYIERKT